MNFSPQQQSAIDKRGASIVLGAAAGSGKTTVMINRIISMLKSGDCLLSELLVLTFTRAAAGSMRAKLENALSQELLKSPDDAAINRAIRELPCAQISTFDSFCTTLVRRYFFALDIHADARMLDENEQVELEDTAIRQTLEDASALCEKGEFPALELLYGLFTNGKQDDDLMRAVQKINSHCEQYPEHEARLQELCGSIDVQAFVLSDLDLIKKRCVAGSDALNFEQQQAGIMPGKDRENALSVAASDSTTYKQMLSSQSMEQLMQADFTRLKAIKEEPFRSEFIALRDIIKKTTGKDAALKQYNAMSKEQLSVTGEVFTALKRLVQIYRAKLRSSCLTRNVLTFSLAQRLAMDLTAREEIAAELRDDFKYIFVDEDQDSNRLQRCMAERLANLDESNLFMVGDVKQSIYRFRNAEPGLFINKMNDYTAADTDSAHCVLRLNNNFRSHSNILECINLIFRHNMRADFFEIDYNQDEELCPPAASDCWQCRSEYIYPTEVVLLQNDTNAKQEELDRAEARQAASLCLENLGAPIFCGGGVRAAEFGDMVVLHRNANSKSELYAQEFAKAGIPFSPTIEVSPLDSYEVSCVLDLLRLLDNRRNDFAMFSVMRMYGFTFDEIISLRCSNQKDSFCQCVLSSNQNKVVAFLAELERLRFLCACRPLWKVLWEIYRSTGFFARCAALEDGENRTENLRSLAAMAEKYCSSDGLSLRAFVDLCSNGSRRLSGGDAQISGNSVHMLTIHKSKGLEFPIVILAGCGDGLFKKSSQEKVRISKELGLALKLSWQDKPLCEYLAGAMDRRERYLDRSEQLRNLYVAATRAVNKLIFTGVYAPGPYNLDCTRFDASCYFDFILPPLLGHPDGAELAERLDILPAFESQEGKWAWRVCPLSLIKADHYTPPVSQCETCTKQEALKSLENMTFTYKHEAAAALPSKKGASDSEKSYELQPPHFLKEISAAAVGSAYHLLLEHTDFKESAPDTLQRLVSGGLLDKNIADKLNLNKLDRLLASLGKELANVNCVREAPFTMLQQENGEQYLVQGIIDCFYVKDGEAVLLDFKSDRVHGNLQELVNRYRPQLALYKSALKKCFNLPCARASLYFLDTGQRVDI